VDHRTTGNAMNIVVSYYAEGLHSTVHSVFQSSVVFVRLHLMTLQIDMLFSKLYRQKTSKRTDSKDYMLRYYKNLVTENAKAFKDAFKVMMLAFIRRQQARFESKFK